MLCRCVDSGDSLLFVIIVDGVRDLLTRFGDPEPLSIRIVTRQRDKLPIIAFVSYETQELATRVLFKQREQPRFRRFETECRWPYVSVAWTIVQCYFLFAFFHDSGIIVFFILRDELVMLLRNAVYLISNWEL